jgi:hypothetical protein
MKRVEKLTDRESFFLGDGCPPARTPAAMAANVNEEENSRLRSDTAYADGLGI